MPTSRATLEERRDRWEGGNVFYRGTAATVKLPSVGTRHIFPGRIVPDSVWRHAQTAQDTEIARDYLPFLEHPHAQRSYRDPIHIDTMDLQCWLPFVEGSLLLHTRRLDYQRKKLPNRTLRCKAPTREILAVGRDIA